MPMTVIRGNPMCTAVSNCELSESMVELAIWRNANPGKPVENAEPPIKDKLRLTMSVLSCLKEGDLDPWTGRKIQFLIRKSARYVVYLDDRLEVQWWGIQRIDDKQGMSVVLANVKRISSASNFLLEKDSELFKPWFPKLRSFFHFVRVLEHSTEAQLNANTDRAHDSAKRIRTLIAESMAMVQNGGNPEECLKVQAMADDQILVAKDQLCRPVFFWWFVFVLLLFLCFAGAVNIFQLAYPSLLREAVPQLFDAGLAGAFGALLSVTARTRTLMLEPESGKRGLRIEAVSRLLIGVGAGILVYLAFNAHLLLKDAINGAQAQTAALWLLCIASGLSEKILPSVLGKAETLVVTEGKFK